jgi:hypothetical protein
VKNGSGVKIFDLECAKSYVGNSAGIPTGTPTAIGTNIYNVECCYGTNLALTHTTEAETGSQETCSGFDCYLGAPVPVVNQATAALSVCPIDNLTADAFGSVDCSTGEAALDFPIRTRSFLTGDVLPRRCDGGSDPGSPCFVDSDCPGGGTCLTDPDVQPCPVCNPTTLTCNGGPNDGQACTPVPDNAAALGLGSEYPTSHECPPNPLLMLGTILSPYELMTETATSTTTDGQFCGFCRDVNIEGSECYEGDDDPFQQRDCPDSSILACKPLSQGDISECGTFIRCDSDADCYAPYESCEQHTGGCFGMGSCRTIVEYGVPAGDLTDGDPHEATIVSTHCIPPTFNPLMDSGSAFPSPGAVAFTMTLQQVP